MYDVLIVKNTYRIVCYSDDWRINYRSKAVV